MLLMHLLIEVANETITKAGNAWVRIEVKKYAKKASPLMDELNVNSEDPITQIQIISEGKRHFLSCFCFINVWLYIV